MAHVQSTGQVPGDVTSASLTLNNVTAGSVLLAIIRQSTSTNAVTGVADNRSNAWSSLCNIVQPSGGVRFYVYKAENVAAGNTTITVSLSAVNTVRWIVAEYNNVPSSSAIEAQISATFSSTTTPSAPPVATTVSGDTIVAVVSCDSGQTSVAPGGSQTARQTVDTRLELQDQIVGAAGSYGSSWVLNPGSAGAYLSIALKNKSAAATLVKWHPGHYIGTYALDSLPSGHVAEVQALPNCVGIGLWYSWRTLETSRGVYDFTGLVAALDAIHAGGLHAYLQIADVTFGGTTRQCPDYLTTEVGGNGGIWQKAGNAGTTPMFWNAAIMARVNAFFTALGAAIDSHPALDVITWREADPGLNSSEYSAAGLNSTNYMTQMQSWADSTKAAFPHTNIGAPGNFPINEANAIAWVDYCYQRGVGIAGPDVFPQPPYTLGGSTKSPTYTDRVIRGQTFAGGVWTSGGFDYRGKIFCANQVQDPDMGRGYTWSPQAFYDYVSHSDGYPQGHLYWWRKDYAFANMAANLQTYWSNATLQPNANLRIKPWLQLGGHALPTAAPTFYNGNINTA